MKMPDFEVERNRLRSVEAALKRNFNAFTDGSILLKVLEESLKKCLPNDILHEYVRENWRKFSKEVRGFERNIKRYREVCAEVNRHIKTVAPLKVAAGHITRKECGKRRFIPGIPTENTFK